MSAENATQPTIGETTLLKALGQMERVAKSQIIGKLPGNNEPKGTWSEGKEPTEVSDADSDVSDEGGEERTADARSRPGKKSDTDYKVKSSPVRKGIAGKDGDDESKDDDADPDDFTKASEDQDGEGDEEEEEEDEDEADGEEEGDKGTDKSFAARARASRRIRKAVEVSPFLRALVRTLGKSLATMERRILRDVRQQIRKGSAAQQAFNKSLGDVLSGMGAMAMEHSDLIKALSSQPARGPKSLTHSARPIHKSFDGGDAEITLPDGARLPQLDKSVVAQRLLVGVQKGLFPASEVVKFETTGIVQPDIYKALVSDERLQK